MLQPGQIILDKYRIVRLIGRGGMGEVYEGENVSIRRRVAIKVLLGEAAMSADIVQRFEREAQAAGRIGNDHILEVLDLGALPSGDRFMVMEFLDGEPLNARISRMQQLTAQQATPLMLQALAGLSAAHHAGIIHRDLKPENLFVLKQKAGVTDFVKIIDFGISKFSQLSNEGMKMTKTGSVMGTPYYMSPEQANGSREADARSDLYAMGVILYECVTGAVPFDGKTFNELLFKIVLSDAPLARQLAPNLEPAFEAIISKAMARDISQRYQTCEEFSQALLDFQAGRRMPSMSESGRVPTLAEPAPAFPAPVGRGLSTAANWSNSGTQFQKRSNAPLIAALLGGTLLVLGGGAFAAYSIMHGSPAAAAASAAPSAPNAGVEVKAPTTVTTPVEIPTPSTPEPVVTVTPSASATSAEKAPEPAPPARLTPARGTQLARSTPRSAPPATFTPPPVIEPPPPPPPAAVTPPPKKKSQPNTTDFGY
ncbi:MAG TPA: serine/threonine-protein kinase [Polyangiaceae bacterium]|nr:serine/threonine-protein kinase [Polyangiaceae bacterium]